MFTLIYLGPNSRSCAKANPSSPYPSTVMTFNRASHLLLKLEPHIHMSFAANQTSKAECDDISGRLNCGAFYAEKIERFDLLEQWKGGASPYMVATLALDVGIDIPDIQRVIHVGIPYSLIDYVQESGRAGRNGSQAKATMFVPTGTERQGKVYEWPLSRKSVEIYEMVE
ncbi:P-loop containing nucleoside triphosphate hydrolase protein [Wilcoxina mikolae CBS 423.85]|nr:P-loop containing nucleoside triphosphate hydrolase protein [Wilcoxina mikolae CBS 423.85]